MNQLEILKNLSTHIANTYVDTNFAKSKWPSIEANAKARIEKGIHQSAFHTLMKQIVNELNLSHCEFLTPQLSDKSSQDIIPDFLQMTMKSTEDYVYLRVPTLWVPHFDFDSFSDFIEKSGDKKVILDLRLNTGGSLSAVGKILGLFGGSDRPFAYTRLRQWREFTMPGLVYPLEDKDNLNQVGDVEKVCSFPHLEWCTAKPVNLHLKKEVYALIGPSTFSCGELLAQGIHELKIGTSIGEKTAGKLTLARDDFELGYGYHACLPFASIVSRERYKIEGKGVKPMIDLVIEDSIEKELSHDRILEILQINSQKGEI
ncbi:MAG: hypothetical protein KC646_17585 [Candidatus Cloacimonetes bacterium]|nr:hypothetical protein [Candidatus Cloacimonadota bacterium]